MKIQSYINHTMATMCLCGLMANNAYAAETNSEALVPAILQHACTEPFQPLTIADALQADPPAAAEPISARGRQLGERIRFTTKRYKVVVERLVRNNQLFNIRIFIHDQAERPLLFVAADRNCRVRAARRVDYDQHNHAQSLQALDPALAPSGRAEPLDPPVPSGTDPGGVRVALVDAGVNYLLQHIALQLARDKNGKLIGFDYWDMDPRPFDSHPIPSIFFTQRHGTRTAGVLVREAPNAALVPYRYPRPDMTRMEQLVTHAYKAGARIMGLPLGGNRKSEWEVFARTAKAHPDMLFIASAGNVGRDIDKTPVYPASLGLDNVLVVTSADDRIAPAERTNWGAQTVHLLVPAERLSVIDFNGQPREVSGSSYAVSRVLALAARLAEQNRNWQGPEIKKAILARALSLPHLQKFVAVGYLPDPLSQPGEITELSSQTLSLPQRDADLELELDLVWLQESGWELSAIENMLRRADLILNQCGIRFAPVTLHKMKVSERLLDFDVHTAHTLITKRPTAKPTVYLNRDTNRENGFEGEAFGRGNSQRRPWLKHTVWLVSDVHEPPLALAHELFHIVSNSGIHSNVNDNLMNTRTNPKAGNLSTAQCNALRENGIAEKLLAKAAQ